MNRRADGMYGHRMHRHLAFLLMPMASACSQATPIAPGVPEPPKQCDAVVMLSFARPERADETSRVLLPITGCTAWTSFELVGFDRIVVRAADEDGLVVSVGGAPFSVATLPLAGKGAEASDDFADSHGRALVSGRAYETLAQAQAAMAMPRP